MGDEDRIEILRRRARLVAIALSGLTGCAPTAQEANPPLETEPPLGPVMDPVREVPARREPEAIEPAWQPPVEVDPDEVRHAEERKRRLRAPPPTHPRVCLSISPMVCLWKKAWDSEEPVD